MLGPHIVVIQRPSLFDGVLNHLLGSRRLWKLAHRYHIRAALDEFFHFKPQLLDIHVQVFKNRCPDAAAFLDQAEKDMFGPDIFMIKSLSLLIGQRHDFPCAICKALKHVLPRN